MPDGTRPPPSRGAIPCAGSGSRDAASGTEADGGARNGAIALRLRFVNGDFALAVLMVLLVMPLIAWARKPSSGRLGQSSLRIQANFISQRVMGCTDTSSRDTCDSIASHSEHSR